MTKNLSSFTDVLCDEIPDSQPLSLPSTISLTRTDTVEYVTSHSRPARGTGQVGNFRSVEELDPKYRTVFTYEYFNLVQSGVIDDALYTDKSMVVCAPTGSGKTVIFEMAIVQLLMEMENKTENEDFKIIYMAPVKSLCTERLTEWYSKFNKFGLLCIEVTGDTDVDFGQLQPYKIIITTPEKWDILTRRWRDYRGLVEKVKLFLIDEVHILNDEVRGPVLEAVVSRMKTIESAAQSAHRIEQLQKQYQSDTAEDTQSSKTSSPPRIRFVAVSATVSNPEDVAAWLGTDDKPAVYYKFGDECRPVKIHRVVEGYPCPDGTSIFKFDIILNYKLWPIIQKYHDGKPTLIFCNTRKSVLLTAEALSREITITFNPEQRAKLTALASTIKNKKLQSLVLAGVGCHHAGMLYEERFNIEHAFRNRDLPILITTTTLAMGVNLPAHLVIVKNTQQYVNGAYQEYSISTVLQMLGRAGRPQFDTTATAVIMTRQRDKARYQALVGGTEPLQSYLHKRLAENLNSEAALGTVGDVAQCVQWLRSTFLFVRAAKDPKRYLGLTPAAPTEQISKKIEEMCVRAMNGLARSGLITMDEASCISSTEAGRLMSVYYLDLETMKLIMKIGGDETLEQLLSIICESHELADMHLRVDERRCLNTLNRNQTAATIRFPMKGKISSRQMKLSCIIQAVLGCLPIAEPSLNQEAMKIMRTANRICKCLVAYVTHPELLLAQSRYFSAVLNSIILAKCIEAHLWENSPYVSKQLKGIGPAFSNLLATAGKTKFMLLEESHPRDLERIMNKAPPAGNMLKKQISLLPKYQLDVTPINEKTVSIRLLLLNQAQLSENMDELTAGDSHKCFVIAGDSQNHILLLKSFIDRDLIRVYDGTMTFEITRKHECEHKISIHCISSTFVGIDAHCEYTFTNLIPSVLKGTASPAFTMINVTLRKQVEKTQPKERKRKNIDDKITQSSEKKRRENALAEKFRILKESFSKASNQIKNELQETEKNTKNVLDQLVHTEGSDRLPDNVSSKETSDDVLEELNDLENNFKDVDFEAFVDDDNFDSILNNIETEIKVNNQVLTSANTRKIAYEESENKNQMKKASFGFSRKKNSAQKDKNYKFIDLLDQNINDDEDESCTNTSKNGFSAAIKTQLDKYLRNSRFASTTQDPKIVELLDGENVTQPYNRDVEINSTNNQSNHFDQKIGIVNTNDACVEFHTIENPLEYKVNFNETNHIINIMSVPPKLTGCSRSDQQSLAHYDIHSKNSPNLINKEILQEPPDNAFVQVKNPLDQSKFNQTSHKISTMPTPPILTDGSKSNQTLQSLSHSKNSPNQILMHKEILQKPIDEEQNTEEIITNLGTIDLCEKKLVAISHHSSQSIRKGNFGRMSVKKCLQNRGYETSIENNVTKELMQIPHNYISQPSSPKCDIYKVEHSIPHTSTFLPENNSDSEFKDNRLSKQAIGSAHHFVAPTVFCKKNKPQLDEESKKLENKYTYSAEKLDVHSKFTTDYEIRVTRKLKIDVDITETILEEKLKPSSETTSRKDCIINNEKKSVADSNIQFNALQTTSNSDNNFVKIIDDQQMKVISEKNINAFNENSNRATTANEAITEKGQHHQKNHCFKSQGNIEAMNEESESWKKVKEQEEKKSETRHDFKSDEAKNKVVVLECQQSNKSNANSIENILKKYSNILRKPQNNITLATTPKTFIQNNNKKRPIKSNKPFKITDIQSLDVPLDNVCDVPTASNNQMLTVDKNTPENPISYENTVRKLGSLEEVLKPENHDDESTKAGYLKQAHISISLSAEKHHNDDYNSQCSPVGLIEADDLINDNDQFNLDHNLLNPKMFLQCYNNDDHSNVEVIPPPPEFSDHATVYSPKIADDVDINYTCNDFDIDLNYTNLNEDYAMNNSIFEGNTSNGEVIDLTPSKEVETWNLDIDDDLVNNSLSSIRQCSTVFRNPKENNSDNNYFYLNSSLGNSRQGKLTHFKFNHKNKLKRRI